MYELRCQSKLDDNQIVDEINKLGYKSRTNLVRDKNDRTRVVDKRGGQELSLKTFWRTLQHPIYAGINAEKWNQGIAVKCHFKGLVSIETFNAANRGKITILDDNGGIKIHKRDPADFLVKKGVRNPDFPYKRYVMCPHCQKPLFGSASRGKLGKYYPAYHCNKRGHYFRVPKKEFDMVIEGFVKSIQVNPDKIDELEKAVLREWNKRKSVNLSDELNLDARIIELRTTTSLILDKIKYLNSENAIRYMEEELLKTEDEIKALLVQKDKLIIKEGTPMETIMRYVRYFLEHLDYLLLKQSNPVAQAGYFSVIFDKPPTYDELISGTQDITKITGVNELFLALNNNSGHVAGDEGFEPPILGPEPSALPLGQSPT